MSTELIINASLPETRIALLENNEIQELHIERDSERGIVGNIYKGKVIRVLPGMQACFVDIGLEKAAFLYVDDIFFPDMRTPLQTQALPEAPATTPNPVRHVVGPVVGPVAPGGAPTVGAPGTPEEHAAAQAEYARQMISHQGAAGTSEASGEPAAAVIVPPLVVPVAPVSSPVAASAAPTPRAPGFPGIDDQPVARAPESAAHEAAEGDEDDESEIESEAVYRPEPLIDAAAWEEDLSDEEDEGDADGATASGAEAANPAAGIEGVEAGPSDAADAGDTSGAAPVAAASSEATPGTANEPAAPAPVAALPTPVRAKAPDPHVRPVRPVGPVGVDDDEDEETSEMPRRRRRREPVNIADIIKEGQEIVVQVAKDPIGTKGARLTCHVSLPGRYLVFMPTVDHIGVSRRIEGEGERRRLKETMGKIRPARTGVIVRTASGKQTDRQLKQDLDYLVTTWNDIQKKFQRQRAGTTVYQDLTIVLRAIRDMFTDEVDKVIVDSKREHRAIMKFVTRFIPQVKDKVELYQGDAPIFDRFGIETEIAKALERKVWLKSGGYLVVDQAEALVAIDVNTGRYVGKKTLEETILKTNLEAVKEIAYQLRLRNCGGIIILDLIDMEKEANKEKVYKALEEAIKKDRARPSILKISSLGLIEMTRKRTRDSMVRSLCEPCPNCEGRGFVKNKLTLAYDIMRDIEREIAAKENQALSIQCHPSVADVLLEDKRDVLEDLERQYAKKLTVRGNGAYHVEQYELVAHRENKNVVWSSEERRQILKARLQERSQQMAAELRRQTESERQERRKVEDERRREQERQRAEKRAQAEEQRRQAAAVREVARAAALAAAQAAAEEQVRLRLAEQGLAPESPEWTEQFASGVGAIMAVFKSQQSVIVPEMDPIDDDDEIGGSRGEGAAGEGDERFRSRGGRRRRGRRGRGSSSGPQRGRGGNEGRPERNESRADRSEGRSERDENRPERGEGQSERNENRSERGENRSGRNENRSGRNDGRSGRNENRSGRNENRTERGVGAGFSEGGGSGDAGSGPVPRADASAGGEGGPGPSSPDGVMSGGGQAGEQGGDPQRRRRRRGRRGGRWRKRPGGQGGGARPGGEGGGEAHHAPVSALPSGRGDGGGSEG